jgi:hypothetical protein
MSTETIKEFLVSLGFQTDEVSLAKFNSGIFKAGVAVTALGGLVESAARELFAGVSNMLSVNRYADELEHINDVAERTDVAASEIMRMNYLAEQNASSSAAMESSLEGLSRAAGLASIGMGRAAKVFEELDIQVKDSNGKLKNSAVLFDDLSKKLQGMEKGKAQGIMSRLGVDPTLLKAMTEDMAEFNAQYKQMFDASGLDAKEAAADADEYNDTLGRLGVTLNLIGKKYASNIFKPLTKMIESMRMTIVANMPAIIAAITKVTEVILHVGDVFFTVAGRVFSIIASVIGFISEANDATDGWLLTIGLIVLAWRAFNLAFLATPVGQILALSAALALLIEDFYVFSKGGDSLVNWEKWRKTIDAVAETVQNLKLMLNGLFTSLFAWVDFAISLLTGDFSRAWFAIKESIMGVVQALSYAFSTIGSVGAAVGGIFGSNAAILTPSPTTTAAIGGAVQNVSQKTEIVVQGAADPASTARAVAGQQDRVNADMTRNMVPRAR